MDPIDYNSIIVFGLFGLITRKTLFGLIWQL